MYTKHPACACFAGWSCGEHASIFETWWSNTMGKKMLAYQALSFTCLEAGQIISRLLLAL